MMPFAKYNNEFSVPVVLDLRITTDAAFYSSFLETLPLFGLTKYKAN